MKPPIFVIGNPRSGTSLLRLMLTCHPRIVIPPECGFVLWLYPEYGGWSAPDNDSRLPDFITTLLRCKKIETWGISRQALADDLARFRPASYAELAAAVYEHYASRTGTDYSRWGDKNNYYLHHIAEIKDLYPDAVFLHIVKDGRNVACSYRRLKYTKMDSKYAPDLPHRVAVIASQWQANIEAVRDAFDAFSWQNVYELRFEDLVTDPVSTLKRVCRDLGEDYDPDMLEYHRVNREQQLEPAEFLQWKAKTLRPPIAAEAARYKLELAPSDREIFESIAGSTLKQYNYL